MDSGDAVLSVDGVYRYVLRRTIVQLFPANPPVIFCLLNPSTADARHNDPTIRRCLWFANTWGCSGIRVVNLFAMRSPDPTALLACGDPIGPENDAWIQRTLVEPHGDVVAGWGAWGKRYPARVASVLALLRSQGDPVFCFGRTTGNQPRHPLMVPRLKKLEVFNW